MRAGTAHLTERAFPDGSIVEIRGNPMPGGGFVATFTDVTAFRRNDVKSRFLAAIGHDLLQPLHAASDAVSGARSEEHTSELQSLMRISYAVFCLKKKNK